MEQNLKSEKESNILANYNLSELESFLLDIIKPKYRIKQIFDAILQAKDMNELNIPKEMITKLSENYILKPLKIHTVLKSKDGTKKYLLQLNDGNIFESVFLTQSYGNTVCLSTQVGCRMGCSFCASTVKGLIRNLTAGEMLAAISIINADNGQKTERNFSNIVLMGSGEPLDNFDNVTKFLYLVTDKNGFNLSERNISLSTCGLVNKIYDLMKLKLNINLCISLHASTDEIRQKIMPVAKAYYINEIVKAVFDYAKYTKRRVILEYCLIKGVNDSFDDCERLVKLFKNVLCHFNVINLNPKDDKQSPVAKKSAYAFVQKLNDLGLSATLRRSQGSDIEGACGQLKVKFEQNDEKNSKK